MKLVKLVLVGVGNLGQGFCKLLLEKELLLGELFGLRFVLVGAADSQGAVCDALGLDPAELLLLKVTGGSVADYGDGRGRAGWSAEALVEQLEADVLIEASPVNLQQGGEPGLSCVRLALQKGMHVVTPNKGPLVLAYRELHDLAKTQRVHLRFDGTVAGGLPAINLGVRDLRGAIVQQLDAVPNLVTGYVMDLLAEGMSWDEALDRARREGALEGDAAWDLEGWDAAAKLVILANAVLDMPATLEDVSCEGITAITPDELIAARERGERYRLVASAKRRSARDYELSVRLLALNAQHPFGMLGRKHMAVRYVTDIYGAITALIEESNPLPSAASILRDLLDIYA